MIARSSIVIKFTFLIALPFILVFIFLVLIIAFEALKTIAITLAEITLLLVLLFKFLVIR